jgi:hypothetical protein
VINKNFSREQVLNSGIELKGTLYDKVKNKPKARAQASLTLFDSKLYLFGGVNNSAMNDLWLCDIYGMMFII